MISLNLEKSECGLARGLWILTPVLCGSALSVGRNKSVGQERRATPWENARPNHGYDGGNETKGEVLSHEGLTVYASTSHRAPCRGAAIRAGGCNVIVSES